MKSYPRVCRALSWLGMRGLALLSRIVFDDSGSILLYVTVSMPVFIGVAGLATEGGLLLHNHRALQSAADASAYSAAIAYSIDNSADITTAAKAVVASYGFTLGTSNNQSNVSAASIANYGGSSNTAIKVDISRPQTTFFASLFYRVLPNSVTATAIVSGGMAGGNNGQCILGLAPTGTAVGLQGNPTITAQNCGVFSNSTSTDPKTPSISLGGNASITAGSVGAAGSVAVGGSATIGPPPGTYTSGDGAIADPYANVSLPKASSTCVSAPGTPAGKYKGTGGTPLYVTVPQGNYCSDIAIQTNAHVTLNPGTFDGNISVATNSSLTLNPGTYILNGGNLTVDSSSALTGVGVTLVFTDPTGAAYPKVIGTPTALSVSSGATVDLQAPAADATVGVPGMLIMADTKMPTTTAFQLWANSATSTGISGVIYVPHGNFTWGGGPILSGGCTEMIAYTVSMQGNADFQNSGCQDAGGGGSGLQPIGSIVTLVK